jgi:ribosomal protein S18 acetylase RimI-like enzyme
VIREYSEEVDRAWAEVLLEAEWGGASQVRRGELLDVLALPGFVAEKDGAPLGLVTYRVEEGECEIAFLQVVARQRGVGTELLEAVAEVASDCERVRVVTTNDNLDALRFYQRRGFRLAAVRPGAVEAARASLKPRIGSVGAYGIPIRDEVELERRQ